MKEKSIYNDLKIRLPLIFSIVFLCFACREDEILPDTSKSGLNEDNQHVNSWILDNMKYWYLWNDALPSSTDMNLDPQSYFNSLLHPDDRFSWIQDNYSDLLKSLQGISKEAGYEFVLFREQEGSDNVILQIVYVKPGSPAESAGLKRGDIVTHINGQQITISNYQTLLTGIRENHAVRYMPLLVGEDKFGNAETVSLSAVEYSENPNYLHKVIESDGKRIGYFVYNFFASGTDDHPDKYDEETDAIFSDFKAQGITDLVIDLRFNTGGSEKAARNLASLIGRGVDESKIFLRRQYNDLVQEEILNDKNLGESFLNTHFLTKANNVGNSLTSGQVYILTSSRTASASELVINALKPFMDVFLIGDTTYGKNVGSVSLYDENDPKNTWGLQPVVVKVYNSLGQSDYSKGFAPDVLDKDNGVFLYPLGDTREALLAQAVGHITGTSTTARKSIEKRNPIVHSIDLKERRFSLVMD